MRGARQSPGKNLEMADQGAVTVDITGGTHCCRDPAQGHIFTTKFSVMGFKIVNGPAPLKISNFFTEMDCNTQGMML